MSNPAIARAARSVRRICVGLLLLGGGLSASLSWAQTKTEKAVKSYVNVTLPTIARMKPWIDKPAPARAAAFATMGITKATCEAPTAEANASGESLAEGAGDLCQAMIAWMQDEDIFTCSRVKFSGHEFTQTDKVNPTVAKLHKSERIPDTRQQLEKAAGCTKKTVTYWGPRALALLDQLLASVSNTGDLRAPSPGAAVPTKEIFQDTEFLCHLAYNGDDKTKSAVVDAADDACYAAHFLFDHEPVLACQTFEKSIRKASAVGASDPLASQAKELSDKLSARLASIDCATQLAITRAAEARAKAIQQATAPPPPPVAAADPNARRNAIIGQINGENQSMANSLETAKRWFDRGEDAEACGYYQKVLGSLRSMETLFAELNRVTGDSSYTTRSREMKESQTDTLQTYGEMCAEAKRRLY